MIHEVHEGAPRKRATEFSEGTERIVGQHGLKPILRLRGVESGWPWGGRLRRGGLDGLGLGDKVASEIVAFAPDFSLEFAQAGTAVGVAVALLGIYLPIDTRTVMPRSLNEPV